MNDAVTAVCLDLIGMLVFASLVGWLFAAGVVVKDKLAVRRELAKLDMTPPTTNWWLETFGSAA